MERQTKAMSNPYLIRYFRAFSCKLLDFRNRLCLLFAVSLDGQIFNKAAELKTTTTKHLHHKKLLPITLIKSKIPFLR